CWASQLRAAKPATVPPASGALQAGRSVAAGPPAAGSPSAAASASRKGRSTAASAPSRSGNRSVSVASGNPSGPPVTTALRRPRRGGSRGPRRQLPALQLAAVEPHGQAGIARAPVTRAAVRPHLHLPPGQRQRLVLGRDLQDATLVTHAPVPPDRPRLLHAQR